MLYLTVDMQSDLEQMFGQLVASIMETFQENSGKIHSFVEEYAKLYASILELARKIEDDKRLQQTYGTQRRPLSLFITVWKIMSKMFFELHFLLLWTHEPSNPCSLHGMI